MAGSEGLDGKSIGDLHAMLSRSCEEADPTRSGTISLDKFAQLLRSTDLPSLDHHTVRRLVEEAPLGGCGTVLYPDFLKSMSVVVDTSKACRVYRSVSSDAFSEARDAAAVILTRSKSVEQIEEDLLTGLSRADTAGCGSLLPSQLSDVVKAVDVGLTNGEVQTVCSSAETGPDGRVCYEEFIPAAFDAFVQVAADKLLATEHEQVVGIENTLMAAFQAADASSRGLLRTSQVREVLTRLGMAEAAVEMCVLNAVVDQKRTVRYVPFARAAALVAFSSWGRNPFENVTVKLEPQQALDKLVGDGPVGRSRQLIAQIAPTLSDVQFLDPPPLPQEELARAQFLSVAPGDVITLLEELFNKYDSGGAGILREHEFRQLLHESCLALTPSTQLQVLSAAEFGMTPELEFEDFVPLMLELAEAARLVAENPELRRSQEEDARVAALDFLLHGGGEDVMMQSMLAEFKAADEDNTGQIKNEVFRQCLQKLDLGITRNEIAFVNDSVDNGTEMIAYEEIVEPVWSLIVQLVSGSLLEGSGALAEAMDLVLRHFVGVDEDGSGSLSREELKVGLQMLPMTAVQVEQLLADATVKPSSGLVDYSRFKRVAACGALAVWGGSLPNEPTVDLPKLEEMALDELIFFLRKLFLDADVDRNGVLDQKEFGELLKQSGLGLSARTYRQIMQATDVHEDGWIEYSEFVPIMIDIVQASRVLENSRQSQAYEECKAHGSAVEYLLDGMPRGHLEESMLRTFEAADLDNDGTLDRRQFAHCIRQLKLGLSKREINCLMAEVNVSNSGLVSYREFVPLMFELIVEIIKDNLLVNQGPLRELSQYFCDTLQEFDVDNRGKIFVNQACDVLSTMHLTAIQVQAIVSEADCDEHQLINWKKFSRVAALMAFEFWGGSLPPNYRRTEPKPKLQLVSQVARELADYRAVSAIAPCVDVTLFDAVRRGDVSSACATITDNADVNAVDSNGWAPLHWAADNGCDGILEVLLRCGEILVDKIDNDGCTALHHAARNGHATSAEMLVMGGTDVDQLSTGMIGRAPIHVAAWHGHAEVVSTLLVCGSDLSLTDSTTGLAAIHYAARHNQARALQALIDGGCDVDQMTKDGRTALHEAALVGSETCIELLLKAGADLELKTTDLFGRTALHCAAYKGHTQALAMLVKAGGPLDTTDNDGKSVLSLAFQNKNLHAAVAAGQAMRMPGRLEPQSFGGPEIA